MKNKISVITLIFLSALITGCSTKYQPRGYSGGYSETRLGENVFIISFEGNGYTSMNQAVDYTLLRSSEVALKNDYKYFIIVDSETYTSEEKTSTSYTANGTISGSYYTANIQEREGMVIRKPSLKNTIICFKEKPNTKSLIYDAEYLFRSLKTKYNLQSNLLEVNNTKIQIQDTNFLDVALKECEEGDAIACNDIGTKYDEKGDIAKRDYNKAADFYTKACELGSLVGCNNLGLLYENGKGVNQDKFKAVELYTKTCNLKNAGGCFLLGSMYYKGEGIRQDTLKAKEFFGKACDLKLEMGCGIYAVINRQ
ncbi:MAG: tetratricopeptide repeat protein [Sulfuricurvum sp.]|nr:tetratricopeptide repeat protein [Sulfuricurvum sp.]